MVALDGLRHSRRCDGGARGRGTWQGLTDRRKGGQDGSRRSGLWRTLRSARRDASLCLHSHSAQGPYARRASRFERRKDRLHRPSPVARHGDAYAKVWSVQIDGTSIVIITSKLIAARTRTSDLTHAL